MTFSLLLKKITMTIKRFFMQPRPVTQFEIAVYKHQANRERLVYKMAGSGSEWQESIDIYVSGFNQDSFLDLENEWNYIIKKQLNEYKTNVSVYETIRKFGDTIQVKTDFNVYLKVKYEHVK